MIKMLRKTMQREVPMRGGTMTGVLGSEVRISMRPQRLVF
jgi:hypothetical protein